jgi:glycosyltransferase involved in cell wall biosynthesis
MEESNKFFRLSPVLGRVSVIIPCHNAADFVSVAVQSALKQSYADVEIIIGDDNSTDDSARVIASFVELPNVRVLKSPVNRCPFALRNLCLKESTGEFLAFLDADDLWRSDKIDAQVAALNNNPMAGLCHTRLCIVDRTGCTISHRKADRCLFSGNCFHLMLRKNGVGTSSVMVRRSVLNKVGTFDERFKFQGDWEMWARIARSYGFVYIPSEMTFYRSHSDNVSKQLDVTRPFAFAVVDKFATEYGLSAAEIEEHVSSARIDLYRSYGLMSLVGGDFWGARRDLLRCLRERPTDAIAWAGLLKAMLYPLFRRKDVRRTDRNNSKELESVQKGCKQLYSGKSYRSDDLSGR